MEEHPLERGTRRVFARGAALLIGALFVVVLNAGPADAHAFLVRSDPASGATVADSPAAIRLWFSEQISRGMSSARLVDGSGTAVAGTAVAAGRTDPRLLEVTVPRLQPGTYGLLWWVLTEGDGHATTGTVVFGVGVPAPAVGSAGLADQAISAATPADVGLRWVRLCVLAGLVGGLAVAGMLYRVGVTRSPAPAADIRSALDRLLGLATGCAAVGVLVGLADLGVHRLGTPGSAWAASGGGLLSATRWGHLWLVREAVLLAMVPILMALRTRTTGRATLAMAAGCGTLGLVWIEAIGSHAAAVESQRAAAVLADALHILAACLWLGVVAALVVVLWPYRTPGAGPNLVRACRGPLTRLVAASVGVLVVTGLYGAGRQVRLVDDLLGSSYGRILLVKTGLLAALLGIGLVTAARLDGLGRWMPGIRRRRAGTAPQQAGRILAAEGALGALLLLAVGMLVETAPAHGPPPAPEVQSRSGTVADLVVTISATPNRPGLNAFTVIAASTRRPPPAAVDGAQLELTLGGTRSVLALQQIGPQRYFGTTQLDVPGTVHVEAVLYRAGQRLTVPIPWEVGPPPSSAQARSGQGRRLAPYVDGLALSLIAAGAVAGAGYRLRRRKGDRVGSETDADRVAERVGQPASTRTEWREMTDAADPRVDAYIAALPEWQQAICREVRDLVHAADPEVAETIEFTDRPYFVLRGNVCALLAAKDHVNVFLYDGAIVPDPDGIVTGGHDNKTARTVAIRRGETINAPALVTMFRQIIANNRAGGWRKIKRQG